MAARQSTPADAEMGARIREARTEARFSQKQLGVALGVTWQQIAKYEAGTNRIAATNLASVAKVAGKPIAWFYGSEPDVTDDERAELERAVLGAVGDIVARRAAQGEARH